MFKGTVAALEDVIFVIVSKESCDSIFGFSFDKISQDSMDIAGGELSSRVDLHRDSLGRKVKVLWKSVRQQICHGPH